MSDQNQSAPPPLNPPPPQPAGSPLPHPESQQRMWNMLCHMSAVAGFVGVPLGNILGPLIIWQLKKNEFPSVDVHGKAALNFQITVTLAAVVATVLAVVLSFFCVGWLLIPLVVLVALAGLIFSIIAGIKANNGEEYSYPWSLTFVR